MVCRKPFLQVDVAEGLRRRGVEVSIIEEASSETWLREHLRERRAASGSVQDAPESRRSIAGDPDKRTPASTHTCHGDAEFTSPTAAHD